MAYETIAGAYPSGFTLTPAYTGLELASTATVGGDGVTLDASGTVHNFGSIAATSTGAAGIDLTHGGRVVNYFTDQISGYDGVVSAGPLGGSNYGTISGTHDGVYLTGGGGIQNVDVTKGGVVGIDIVGGAAEATNYGTVTGGQAAVSVETGIFWNGSVRYHAAVLSGPDGFVATAAATLNNYATITGNVSIAAGGRVNNGVSSAHFGLIEGGVYATGGDVTISNFGTIDGTGGTSVALQSASDRLIAEAGSVFIGAVEGGGGTLDLTGGTGTITGLGLGGTVSGSEAIDFSGFDSFIVKGDGSWTLTGASLAAGQSLTLAQGSTANLLIGDALMVAAGSVVIDGAGTLAGGGTISLGATAYLRGGDATAALTNADTIAGAGFITLAPVLDNLAGGVIDASTGRLELARSTVTNGGLIEATGPGALVIGSATLVNTGTVAANSLLELNGAVISGGTVSVAAGAMLVGKGASTITGAGVANAGTLTTGVGGLTITGAVTGTGQARIAGGGVLEVDGALGEKVTFADSGPGTLVLGDSAAFTGTVAGLSKTGANQIDLKDIAYDASDTVAYSAKTHALTVDTAGGKVLATITLKDSYAGSTFTLSDGGADGTVITDPRAVAFASATAGFGAPASVASAALQPPAPLPPILAHA